MQMKRKPNVSHLIDGQIGFFDLQNKVKLVSAVPDAKNMKFENIKGKYYKSCTRIAQIESMLLVELNDKTLVFNQNGELESTLDVDVMLRPKDKIIIANIDKSITEHQLKVLRKIKTEKYIKRKSDNNIIIPYDTFSVVIYPTGHLSKWMHTAIYKDDEIFNINELPKMIEENRQKVQELQDEETLKLGDIVEFDYAGKCIGEVVHIYNNGESVNVSWDNKITSFYYKNLKKIG